MVLIIGGYAQGKLDYACSHYKDAKEHIFMLNEEVKKAVYTDGDLEIILKEALKKDPDLIVIATLIGCGIIPLKEEDRILRRMTGRLQCRAAELADEVIKVECGIGHRIK